VQIPPEFYPKIKPSALSHYKMALECRLPPPSQDPLLFVSLSNNRPASSLSPAFYARLLNQLHISCPCRVAISCLPSDEEKGKALLSLLRLPATCIPLSQLDPFICLLSLCDMAFIGDGGIMHLAAALDKPQLVLFGATKIEEWRPLSEKALCLYHPDAVEKIADEQILSALIEKWYECRALKEKGRCDFLE
jgi:ADP-heptose:LPS heptosyltransferase